MPRGFGRLPFLGRRSAGTDASAGLVPAAPRRTLDPDAAPVGPPILMPAAIIRQVLFDSIELTPVWAVRRLGAFATAGAAASGSAATAPAATAPAVTAEAAPKRTRRAKSGGAAPKPTASTKATPAANAPSAAPSRTRKRRTAGEG